MNFQWESEKERLLRSMRIPAKKKLEWLGQMHKFMREAYSKRQRDIFWELRKCRS